MCGADGTWFDEDTYMCSSSIVRGLKLDYLSGNSPAGTATLLTQVLVAVIRGGAAFGVQDVRDVALVLRISLETDVSAGNTKHV